MPRKGRYTVYTDGACRGNPGKGGCGATLVDPHGRTVASTSKYVGDSTTNNRCEYQGALEGIRLAKSHGVQDLVLKSDSQLMCKQVRGEYRVKSDGLRSLHNEFQHERQALRSLDVEHIPRESNKVADSLANAGIDSRK